MAEFFDGLQEISSFLLSPMRLQVWTFVFSEVDPRILLRFASWDESHNVVNHDRVCKKTPALHFLGECLQGTTGIAERTISE